MLIYTIIFHDNVRQIIDNIDESAMANLGEFDKELFDDV